ncbi:MAG TPA: helix-turn-helix domain-containing protein [Ktedonobacteraceae bacterium]|jgi:uncharacterized membrane protein/DNA-binding XRE family transcriptional regulator
MSKGRNEILKWEREQRGWSQARLAELISTDAATVSRWERGYATPSPYFREHLCRLFEKSAQDLGLLPASLAESEQKPHLSPSPIQESSCEERNCPQPSDRQGHAVDQLSRRLASLSYLLGWISGLFLFLLVREKRFVRFHSLQSLLFFGGSHVLSITLLVLLSVTEAEHESWQKYLGAGLALLLLLNILFTVIVWMMGMIQAWQGRSYQLPFVGRWSEQIVTRTGPTFTG